MDRDQVKIASGLLLAAGIWLILAPFILDFSFVKNATGNSIVIGAAVLILAAVREWGDLDKTSWASWVNFVLGLWLIVAPFVMGFGFSGGAVGGSVVLGIIIAVASAWSGSVRYIQERPA